jgi:hypothetical protein
MLSTIVMGGAVTFITDPSDILYALKLMSALISHLLRP